MPGRYYFLLLQGKLFILFSVFFPETFWNNVYLTYIPLFWPKDLVYDYFLSLKDSCILFYVWIFFVKLSYIFSQFLLSWPELRKCTPFILMKYYDLVICLGLSILFWYATPHKTWLFKKFIFELEAFSHNSKINSTSVRQLKPLKKVAVS